MNQFNFHNLVKVEKKIGKGNFATVYKGALKKDSHKKIAVKAFQKFSSFTETNGK